MSYFAWMGLSSNLFQLVTILRISLIIKRPRLNWFDRRNLARLSVAWVENWHLILILLHYHYHCHYHYRYSYHYRYHYHYHYTTTHTSTLWIACAVGMPVAMGANVLNLVQHVFISCELILVAQPLCKLNLIDDREDVLASEKPTFLTFLHKLLKNKQKKPATESGTW